MKEELIKQLEKNFYEGLDRIKPHIVGHMTATNLIVNSFQEAIQAISQSESKPITKEEIEYRIKEEYKKHRNSSILVGDKFHWAKIAASKIYALLPQPHQTK